MAKNVELIAVKVLNDFGFGTYGNIMAGLEYVVKEKIRQPHIGMVANLSLGGSRSTVFNDVVQRAVNQGVVVVVSAGNDNADACTKCKQPQWIIRSENVLQTRLSHSTYCMYTLLPVLAPASATAAITVAASTPLDQRAVFSNYGPCCDLFAPGLNILSAGIVSDWDTKVCILLLRGGSIFCIPY